MVCSQMAQNRTIHNRTPFIITDNQYNDAQYITASINTKSKMTDHYDIQHNDSRDDSHNISARNQMQNIMTCNRMPFSIMILIWHWALLTHSIMTLNIMTPRKMTDHYNIQHNESRDNTLSIMVRSIMMHSRMAQNITTRNRMPFSVMILMRN